MAPALAADASSLDLVRAAMREKPPSRPYDAVYNDECMLSFDTLLSADGLYVSLTSFQGFGAEHVALDHEKTGNRLYALQAHARRQEKRRRRRRTASMMAAIGGEAVAVDVEKWRS